MALALPGTIPRNDRNYDDIEEIDMEAAPSGANPGMGHHHSIMTTHPEYGPGANIAVRRNSFGIAHPLQGEEQGLARQRAGEEGDEGDDEDPYKSDVEDIADPDRKAALKKELGGDVRKTIKEEVKVTKKQLLIETIFDQFDDDKSGAIDFEEFYLALRTCDIQISKKVAKKLLDDMDNDQSGTVDRDEFVDFFRQVDNLEEFAARVELAMERHVVRGKIMTLYIFVNMGTCFALTLIYIQARGNAPVTFWMLVALASMFVLALTFTVFYPICRIKLAPAVERTRKRVHDILHREKVKPEVDPADIEKNRRASTKQATEVEVKPPAPAPSYRRKAHVLYGGSGPSSSGLPALPAPEHERPMALPQPEPHLALEDVEHEDLQGHSHQLALAGPSGRSNSQLALAHHTGAAASSTALALQGTPSGKKKGIFNRSHTRPSVGTQLAQMRDDAGITPHGYDAREFLDARRDQEILMHRGQCYNSFNVFTANRNGKKTGVLSPLGGVAILTEDGRPDHLQAADPQQQYLFNVGMIGNVDPNMHMQQPRM